MKVFPSLLLPLAAIALSLQSIVSANSYGVRITRTVNSPPGTSTLLNPGTTSLPKAAPAVVNAPFTPIGIQLHYGNPMTAGMNVYIIWYGSWVESSKSIIRNFINSLGPQNDYTAGSVRAWWAINSLYYDHNGSLTDPTVNLVKEVDDSYSEGATMLTDTNIFNILKRAVTSGLLPADQQKGMYLILTSKDVTKLDMCTSYCGWHSYGYVSNSMLKYGFIGDASTRCLSSCSLNYAPNGNRGIDGMVSVIAHELTETSSDPDIWTWYNDADGNENADKCAWSFAIPSGSNYNLVGANGQRFAVQQNWNPKTGGCAVTVDPSYPPPPPPPLPPCDSFVVPNGVKAFSLESGTSYRDGTLVTLYTSSEQRGDRSRFESNTPGACELAEISPVNSLKIQWNMNKDSGYKMGCKSISLWSEIGCSGRNHTFEFMASSEDDKIVKSLRTLEHHSFDWTLNTKSVGCNY